MLTKEQIKTRLSSRIKNEYFNLTPKTETFIINDIELKDSIDYYTVGYSGISYCEKARHILLRKSKQHSCPMCGVNIPLNKNHCSKQCAARNPDRVTKTKKTNLEKYGAVTFTATEEGRKQISDNKSNLSHEEKEITNKKRRQTNIERYGVDAALQNPEKKQKAIDTWMTKYGVDNPSKNAAVIQKIKDNHKEPSPEVKLQQKINRFKTNFNNGDYHYDGSIPLFTEEDHHLEKTEMLYQCLNCGKEFYRKSLNITRCTHCFPYKKSVAEIELETFFADLGVDIKRNSRNVIKPLELDIVVEDRKIAIEYDGAMYHSFGNDTPYTKFNKKQEDKNYHLTKTKRCLEQGYQLYHIFENEWVDSTKRDIWKSILQSKLGFNKTIYARKCKISIINNGDKITFLNENHLQGDCSSYPNYGLIYDGELVALLTMSKSRYNKNYDWEITRYCNKKYHNVVGGFSRLLKSFRKNNTGTIITYADKRYSNGDLYRNNGFTELKDSPPNYWYFNFGKRQITLESRIKYQKHKLGSILDSFDASLTEAENMFNNGYRRIFDCGNKVFILL